jgi:1-aminocyclopropane-1-carboxylate deaminase
MPGMHTLVKRDAVPLPSPFSSIPRYPLLIAHPTPLEPLNNLTHNLFSLHKNNSSSSSSGNDTDKAQTGQIKQKERTLWLKNESLNSNLASGGGNKIRKLEYVLPHALDQGATVLVSTGGRQSNHLRQVAAAAARVGIKVGCCLLKFFFSVFTFF